MDPMCGWCFGFSKQLNKVRIEYPLIPIELICGGMVPPASEGLVGKKGDYIIKAIPKVEEQTGVAFGAPYIKGVTEGTAWNGSLKPSTAINIMKNLALIDVFDFCQALQKAYFEEGKSLNSDDTYIEIFKKSGINASEFLYLMGETNWIQRTIDEFTYTGHVGITGFPTIVGEIEDKLVLISYGYATFEQIQANLNQLQAKNEV
jgi:putative protein-disulfide isomerase